MLLFRGFHHIGRGPCCAGSPHAGKRANAGHRRRAADRRGHARAVRLAAPSARSRCCKPSPSASPASTPPSTPSPCSTRARWRPPATARHAGRAGRPLGPLDGVPCTVKDLVDLAGFPTRRGSRATDPTPATEDAPSVRRPESGRRGDRRQDHHHRVRLEIPRRLPAARHHAQPVEPGVHHRRLVLGRRGGGRGRVRAVAYRHRRRRLDPHPRRLVRPGRAETQLRPRAAMAARARSRPSPASGR